MSDGIQHATQNRTQSQSNIAFLNRAVGQLRELAGEFGKQADLDEGVDFVRQMAVITRAGQLIMGLSRRGSLASIAGLRERVEYHSQEEEGVSGVAHLMRCPTNLFIELVGCHQLEVRNLTDKTIKAGTVLVLDGSVELLSDFTGGLLPKAYPELFAAKKYARPLLQTTDATKDAQLSQLIAHDQSQRYRHACLFLADLVQAEATPEKPAAQSMPDIKWTPPAGMVGAKDVCNDDRFRKEGQNVPRTTLQKWQERDRPTTARDRATGETYYPEQWIYERLAKWTPRRKT